MGDYLHLFAYAALYLLAGLAILSVMFAPIAGVTCVVIARARRLPAIQYGVAGGLSAAALFLPWVYLVLRMLDKRPPKGLVVLAYGTLYSAWAYGPVIGGFGTLQVLSVVPLLPRFYDEPHEILIPPVIYGVIILLNCVSIMASALWIGMTVNSQERDDGERDGVVPQVAYVAPFGLAAIFVMLTAIGPMDFRPVLEFLNLVD